MDNSKVWTLLLGLFFIKLTSENKTGDVEESFQVNLYQTDDRSDLMKFESMMKNIYRLHNGDYLYQGDIRIGKAQLMALYGISSFGDYLWPNATILYRVNQKLHPYKSQIEKAMRKWEASTCVQFQESDNANGADFVDLVDYRWSFSYVGRQGGRQRIGVALSYFSDSDLVHLLGHAIGLRHAQCAQDRDDHIIVRYSLLPYKFRYNYDKESSKFTHKSLFDFHSVMAYNIQTLRTNNESFAEEGHAIVPVDPLKVYRHFFTDGPSFSDLKQVNEMYQCNRACRNAQTLRCYSGGYVGVNCACECPPDTIGDFCQHRIQPGSQGVCSQVVTEEKTLFYPDDFSLMDIDHCAWWFRARDKDWRVQVTVHFNSSAVEDVLQYDSGCSIFFQIRSRQLYEGSRYCWRELFDGKVFRSLNRDLILDHFGYEEGLSFSLSVKFVSV